MPSFDNLSDHDKAVLKSIFDPNVTLGDLTSLEESDLLIDQGEDSGLEDEDLLRAKDLEVEAIKWAEAKEYDKALELMQQTVCLTPERAASYNNRAQLYRLLGKDEEALQDLDRSLELSQGTKSKARAQALCQRGVIMRKLKREDEAKRDFKEAAELGSSFAKKQMVELNPYAALCNKMLRQVMDAEMVK